MSSTLVLGMQQLSLTQNSNKKIPKLFTCPLCPKRFGSQDAVSAHKRSKHDSRSTAVNNTVVTPRPVTSNAKPGGPISHKASTGTQQRQSWQRRQVTVRNETVTVTESMVLPYLSSGSGIRNAPWRPLTQQHGRVPTAGKSTPFSCPYCKKAFTTQNAVLQHQRDTHNKVKVETLTFVQGGMLSTTSKAETAQPPKTKRNTRGNV